MSHKTKEKTYFENRIASLGVLESKANKLYLFFSLSRLFVFAAIVLCLFLLYPSSATWWSIIIGFALFLYTVKLSIDFKYKRDKLRELILINKEELEVLSGNWSAFENGSVYKTEGHPYSEDLDLWGEKSVFQLINRTVSKAGSDKLAKCLHSGANDVSLNIDGINEMLNHREWSQEFCAEGRLKKREGEKPKPLTSLREIHTPFYYSLFSILLPLSAWTSIFLLSYNLVNSSQFIVILIIILSPIILNLKKTNALSKEVLGFESKISIMKKQLEQYARLHVKNKTVQQHQTSLFEGQTSAEKGIQNLEKLYNGFEYRNNAIVGLLLNCFLCWDLHLLLRYKKWWKKYHSFTSLWEEKISDIEVWISGASFAHSREVWCFAEFSKEDEIKITAVKHPFVDENKAVSNDVKINTSQNFLIITGPNMAGKSTYLRSTGLCFVFAHAGFPVPASKCKIPNLHLYTSMRTSDDLSEEQSYFYAELKRLRFIVDAIEKGEKVFIILDEILKGTNSKDKAEGSSKFLKKLKSLGAKGIIATHDLSLCELAHSDEGFYNMFFDSLITDDDLQFDYQIKDGVCKNMNASFLLKKMGLTND